MLGRPGTRRPGWLALCGVLLVGLAVTGCSRPEPVRPRTALLPSFLEPSWLQAGLLDVRFTVSHSDDAAPPRRSSIHSILSIGEGGRIVAMRTAQSADGVVVSSTQWRVGARVESAELPSCTAVASDESLPATVGDLLASIFGPVDSATTTGWSVDGAAASRLGSTEGVVERTQLVPLPQRTPREVNVATGVVVSELNSIRIHHQDGVTSAASSLPSCGAPDRSA